LPRLVLLRKRRPERSEPLILDKMNKTEELPLNPLVSPFTTRLMLSLRKAALKKIAILLT